MMDTEDVDELERDDVVYVARMQDVYSDGTPIPLGVFETLEEAQTKVDKNAEAADLFLDMYDIFEVEKVW